MLPQSDSSTKLESETAEMLKVLLTEQVSKLRDVVRL